MFQDAGWLHCRVHLIRNALSAIPEGSQDIVASVIRTIFAQPDRSHENAQFDEVTRMLHRSHPKVAEMLDDAWEGLLTFAMFSLRHWPQIWSTNPLERINKEIKRRIAVVGVFPNAAALMRLLARCLLNSTTNVKRASAATFQRYQWLSSRLWPSPPASRSGK